MSHKIGKNNERNRANRKKQEPIVPLYDARTSEVKQGGIIKDGRGRKYRIGDHGELIRLG